jgi:hypothetical protein
MKIRFYRVFCVYLHTGRGTQKPLRYSSGKKYLLKTFFYKFLRSLRIPAVPSQEKKTSLPPPAGTSECPSPPLLREGSCREIGSINNLIRRSALTDYEQRMKNTG